MSDPTRTHDWDRFARWNPPPLMATSNAPKPYKPPVWQLALFAVAVIWAIAFAFGLAWIALSPLMPPTGMP